MERGGTGWEGEGREVAAGWEGEGRDLLREGRQEGKGSENRKR